MKRFKNKGLLGFTLAEVEHSSSKKNMFPRPLREREENQNKERVLDFRVWGKKINDRNSLEQIAQQVRDDRLSNNVMDLLSKKLAFTLAEVKNISPRPLRERVRVRGKKVAFTLAEVMIVVTIIGVVAMLVLPHFMQDMSERINSHKQANLVQKITKSVELMAANGDYQGIYDTEQFVNKLSKYLKISKVCDSEHIADCWPTKKIKTAKGQEYEVSNAKTSKDLYVRGGSDVQNVGLVLADGSNLILTFNPDAPEVSSEKSFTASTKSLPVGGGKFAEFAYSSNATNAIDFIMDVNGKTGPNREIDVKGNFYDIRSFKIATFTPDACTGTRVKAISTYCLVELGMDYEPYNCSTRPRGDTYCVNNNTSSHHYAAGARYACEDIGKRLPSSSELEELGRLNLSGWNFTKYAHTHLHPNGGSYAGGYGSSYKDYAVYQQAPVLCIKKD